MSPLKRNKKVKLTCCTHDSIKQFRKQKLASHFICDNAIICNTILHSAAKIYTTLYYHQNERYVIIILNTFFNIKCFFKTYIRHFVQQKKKKKFESFSNWTNVLLSLILSTWYIYTQSNVRSASAHIKMMYFKSNRYLSTHNNSQFSVVSLFLKKENLINFSKY